MKLKQLCKTALLLLFILFLTGGLIIIYLEYNRTDVIYQPEAFTRQTGFLNNPDRGWYQLYGYQISDSETLSPTDIYLERTDSNEQEYRLALVEINLNHYRNSELSETAIDNIRAIITAFETTNMKLILRFLYDWDGMGKESEPDEIHTILMHMDQLTVLLHSHPESIFTLQGAFVGSWAEMHHSRYLSDEDVTLLISRLADVTPESVFLSVRTPGFYRAILRQLEKEAGSSSPAKDTLVSLKRRLGLFNDALLGSENDLGTYSSPSSKEDRLQELTFQNQLCQTVPNGGEVVVDNPYNNLENAITDLRMMHISYLNQVYDKEVIDKWKETTYTGADMLYQGKSGYQYITDHLGYRFSIDNCRLDYTPFWNETADVAISITNTGFANAYTYLRLQVMITSLETGNTHTLINTNCQDEGTVLDARTWNSGETVTLPVSFCPYDYPDGDYQITLKLTQESDGTPIYFANTEFEKNTGIYSLGKLSIQH